MGQRRTSELIGEDEPAGHEGAGLGHLAEAVVWGIAYAGTLSKFGPKTPADEYEPPHDIAAEAAALAVRDWRAFVADED